MNIVINYEEISYFIEQEFKISPSFVTIDEKSFEVSYKPGLFFPTFSLQFHVDNIVDNTISISYNCGPAASLMIAGFVKFIENNIPSGIDVNAIDQHINIYPLQLTQTEMAFRYVKLSDIVFRESSLNITLDMI